MASKSTSHPLEVTSSMAANSTMVATKNAINSSLNNTQTTLAQNSTTTAADFANPPPLSSTRLLIDDGTTHPSLTGVEWVSAVDAVVANGPPPQPPPPAQCFKNLPPSEARLVLGTNFTCAEIGDWNTAAMAQKMPASWPDELRRLCQLFLNDVRQQCAERIRPPLTTYQMVGAVETFYHTFAYAVNARASSTQEVIDFFQQQLLRYAVEVRLEDAIS